VASPMLFRYAHDRNLFWLDRLPGRPAPIWILSDGTATLGYYDLHIQDGTIVDQAGRLMLRIDDYAQVDRRGRFMLLKKKNDTREAGRRVSHSGATMCHTSPLPAR